MAPVPLKIEDWSHSLLLTITEGIYRHLGVQPELEREDDIRGFTITETRYLWPKI